MVFSIFYIDTIESKEYITSHRRTTKRQNKKLFDKLGKETIDKYSFYGHFRENGNLDL